MRKTRLVILPTKCLHSIGFLLLFLSCPVIGDWGRIRPESENSHNAIQIEREGTCGLERDPPGGLLSFLNENGSQQCRPSEDSDLILKKTSASNIYSRRFNERQADVQRIAQRRNLRMSENIRRIIQKEVGKELGKRDIRSRSSEPRRSTNRKDVRRSLSLSRSEKERAVERQRSVPGPNIRQFNERRRESERLPSGRRVNERQTERRVDEKKREREMPNERRENEREVRNRRVRDTRLARATETERRDVRRERSVSEQSRKVLSDISRRQARENIRERSDSRLSLARREIDARRIEKSDNRRSMDRMASEGRLLEIRKPRSMESVEVRKNSIRMNRNSESRRVTENRRFVTLSPKLLERNVFDRRLNEKLEGMKPRSTTVRQVLYESTPELNFEKGKEKFFGGIGKLMDLSGYESYKPGDWTTNCVIGAVVYFLTTRQAKAV